MSKETANQPVITASPADRFDRYLALEAWAVSHLRRISVPLLRGAIGVVFIWFGALKIDNTSPVSDFVANTLPWFDRAWVVPALGVFEMAIGVAMMIGRYLFVVCVALTCHLVGTFLALVMQPSVTFQHGNLFLLTTEGEFVIKNLVFIAAGLVVAARFHQSRTDSALGG
jgi:putative oxidoreductase